MNTSPRFNSLDCAESRDSVDFPVIALAQSSHLQSVVKAIESQLLLNESFTSAVYSDFKWHTEIEDAV